MRKTTIKTQVTFTDISVIAFNSNTNELEQLVVTCDATAKTEKGIEKLAQNYVDECYKIVKVASHTKYSITYEMDRNLFMKYATQVIE